MWVWPEGLAHYVEAHDVRLPDDLIATMRDHHFTIPKAAAAQRKQHLDGEPWLRWCAAQVPARPAHEDACSLPQAQALAASLCVPGYRVQIDAVSARWRVAVDFPGARVVDLIPPCSAATLALHLHRWRRVPPEQQLSVDTAQKLLGAAFPPLSAWSRLTTWLRRSDRTPPKLTVDESGFWKLSVGPTFALLMPLDSPGWRFLISQILPGNPWVYATINRRLLAAFGG